MIHHATDLPPGSTFWQITRCRRCQSRNGFYKQDDDRGDYDYNCLNCGFNWKVDGSDY